MDIERHIGDLIQAEQRLDLLKKFCSTEREALKQPWSQGNYTYVSDGRIALRVSKLAEYPIVTNAGYTPPNAAYVFESYPVDSNKPVRATSKFVALPALPKKVVLNPDAKECILIEHRKFDGHYIRLAAQLPLVRFSPSTYGVTDPMPLKFEGGEGLLMPLRYESSIVTLELIKGTHWKQFSLTKKESYEKESKKQNK